MNPDGPLVSCLCVTEDRAAFMLWLLWCCDRQTYARREVVIVASSASSFEPGDRNDIRVVGMPTGSSIASKRNRALKEARGEIITWFDDDDWQHPNKCALLAEALADGTRFAGSCEGSFVNLRS